MSILSRALCLVASLAAALSLACSGGASAPPEPDVHVAGYVFNGTVNVAMYWKNGKPVTLTDGTRHAKAFAVVASGGDVYVAGGQVNASGVGVATYWKNGVPVALTDGTRTALAESIAVSGGDVYVAGYENGGPGKPDAPTCWKNGVAVPLTDGSYLGEATSVAVSGQDVYVAGWTYDMVEPAPNTFVLGPVAKVWRNGVPIALHDLATTTGVAESLLVSGPDVFVAGYTAPSTGGSQPYTAQYWKNGVAVPLTDGTHGAKAFSVALAGSTVYAGGFTTAGGGDMATIWKDGQEISWTLGRTTAVILSLAVSRRDRFGEAWDVYAAGFEDNTAKYWHNGLPVSLTDGMQEAQAISIFVETR